MAKTDTRTNFQYRPLREQIRAAQPLAEDLIAMGIDPSRRTNNDTIEHITTLVPRLDALFEGMEEKDRFTLTDSLEAARAVGIALGLLLRPEAYLKGGAK